jgi:hypothetical protein
MIMQWENARVSSERPLALVIVKLNKTAKILANYLARCPQLAKRNVKTTFVDGQCLFSLYLGGGGGGEYSNLQITTDPAQPSRVEGFLREPLQPTYDSCLIAEHSYGGRVILWVIPVGGNRSTRKPSTFNRALTDSLISEVKGACFDVCTEARYARVIRSNLLKSRTLGQTIFSSIHLILLFLEFILLLW